MSRRTHHRFTGAITAASNSPVAAIASVSLITGITLLGPPLDALAGLSGSTGGALLIYVAPALMALKLRASPIDSSPSDAGDADGALLQALGPGNAVLWAMIAVGTACGVIGTLDEVVQIVAASR